jgi:hypothetical protein
MKNGFFIPINNIEIQNDVFAVQGDTKTPNPKRMDWGLNITT